MTRGPLVQEARVVLITKVQTGSGTCVLAILVGANARQIEEVSQWTCAEDVHVEAAASLAELALFDLDEVDVILVWDEGETIGLLRRQFAAAQCWIPMVAIGEGATVRGVVRAMSSGAADYIDWPGEAHLLLPALRAAQGGGKRSVHAPARSAEALEALSKLSPRERQVLGLMADGMTNKVIARSLEISPRTVEIHRANMLEKLKSKSSADAIRLFFEATMPPQSTAVESTLQRDEAPDVVVPEDLVPRERRSADSK